MRKNVLFRLLFLCTLMFFVLSCREEFNGLSSNKENRSYQNFKTVNSEDIPEIIAHLENITHSNDLKIELKDFSNNKTAKTETTIYGEVETDIIGQIETQDSNIYYFKINNDSEITYNLQVTETQGQFTEKIVVYIPEGDFDPNNFTGSIITLDINGNILETMNYVNGKASGCPDNPNNGGGSGTGGGHGPETHDPGTGVGQTGAGWGDGGWYYNGGYNGGNGTVGCGWVDVYDYDQYGEPHLTHKVNTCTGQMVWYDYRGTLRIACNDNVGVIVITDAQVALFISHLNTILQNYGHPQLSNATVNYLFNHRAIAQNLSNLPFQNQQDADFMNFAVNFFTQNPGTNWAQFENWFVGNGEGNDGGDIFDINDYTNVQVQSYSSLPSRNDFYSAFPKNGTAGMQNTAVYQLVGGNLYNLHQTFPSTYWNACAIRVSRGLNYSGQPLPVFKNKNGKQRTEKGADNKNYILDAASMLAYMLKAYPNNPPLHLENKSPEEYLNALKGKWGIYIMLPKPNSNFGATGHADFFSYSGCLSGCYFTSAKEIYFWELN